MQQALSVQVAVPRAQLASSVRADQNLAAIMGRVEGSGLRCPAAGAGESRWSRRVVIDGVGGGSLTAAVDH